MALELVQKDTLRATRTEIIVDVENVHVKKSGIFSNENFKVPLERISKDPLFFRKISWAWLVAAAIATVLSTLGVSDLLQPNLNPDSRESAIVFASFFAIVAFVFAIQCLRKSFNGIVFRDAGTGSNIFFIHPTRPSKKIVDQFVEQLSELISNKYFSDDMPISEKIAI